MPSWEEVLAAVEEDVRRTEELLTATALPDIDGAQSFMTLANAPRPPVGAGELPRLDDMPAVPYDLLGRIEALRTRVASAQHDVQASLDAADRQPAVPRRLAPVTHDLRARYIDTSL
jgi:hypothetical protein